MKKTSLSSLVVSCKDYKPDYNWYFSRSKRCVCGVQVTTDYPGFDIDRLNQFEASDDYILMPECPRMTDEEAAGIVKRWCEEYNIPYNDDMDRIEEAYRYYYDY